MSIENPTVLTPDVLIVGAGVVGVPLAIGLKKRGLDVLLVERSVKIKRIFKGEYIQPGPLEVFRKLGMDYIFEKDTFDNITELHFHDMGPNNEVLSEIVMNYPTGVCAKTFTHDEILRSLRTHGEKELGEQFWIGGILKPQNQSDASFYDKPEFELKHATRGIVTVKPKWVVGTDGRHSTVRKWMKGKEAPKNQKVILGAPKEFIIGAEIATPAPKKNCYQVFRSNNEGTLFAFSLPTVGQRLYYSALDKKGIGKEQWTTGIQKIIGDVTPTIELGQLDTEAPILGCAAYQTWLGPVTRGRFLLAGDSIAATTPYGGQGITAGMEHVDHLIENFNWSTKSTFVRALATREYTALAEHVHSRINLINFGIYYLFFARQPLFKETTAYVLKTWKENPELPRRVMRLFGGVDRDKPSVPELLSLWGIKRKQLFSFIKPALGKKFARFITTP